MAEDKDELIYLDGDEDDILPKVCFRCNHHAATEGAPWRSCAAFAKIPASIWLGKNPHTKPYRGDGGIRFEPFVANAKNDSNQNLK